MTSKTSGIPFTKSVLTLAALFLLCFLGLSPLARAAVITVTNTNNDGAGSLRQAVADANAGDEIQFGVTGTITLTSGLIEINKNLTITGPGARLLTVDGNGAGQIFWHSSGKLSISGLNLINISTACIGSTVAGPLSLLDCRFEGMNGSGLYIYDCEFSIKRCLITNCRENAACGAGLYACGSNGTITNCTFSGNSAIAGGGALWLQALLGTPMVKISHCTFTGNECTTVAGGGGIYNLDCTVQIRNTIVAGNTDSSGTNTPNLKGDFISKGYNLIGDDTGAAWGGTLDGATDTVGVADAGLEALADNGGPTNTHALQDTSPAVDNGVGTDIDGNSISTDQRGYCRPFNGKYDIGAFEFGSTGPCQQPPGGTDPTGPDPIPPGGPAHQIGGGGDDIGPPLPPGYTWTPNGQGGTLQDMTMALASLGNGTGTASGKAKRDEAIPGLMFCQTCPKGESRECWLALGECGTTPTGVEYSTNVRWNHDVRVIDMDMNWPQSVLQSMAAGRHCLGYWLQTTDGLRSNCRVGYLDLSADTASFSFAKTGPVPNSATELTFKVQLGFFNKATGFVERVASGMCIVETEEGTWGTYPITDGLLTFTIPLGVTSEVGFNSVTFNGTKTVRMEFKDGYIYCYDQDHRDAVVEVYQCVDGESYAMEYYQDLVYICNQGVDPDGPILGRMFGK